MSRLLVCCPSDLPSANMKEELLKTRKWNVLGIKDGYEYIEDGNDVMVTIPGLHITSDGLDEIAKDFGIKVDEIVFMSKHKATSAIPTLTVHPIGNYKAADFGGKAETLVKSSPASMTDALRKIALYNNLEEYKVSFEVTHHGPYLDVPTYFIEIGSDETHWCDKSAAQLLSKVVTDTESVDYLEAVGFGGGHYAPRFTEIALAYKINFGHMIPGYQVDGMDDETVLAYLKKATESTSNTNCIYMHKKAFKKSEARRYEELISSAGYEIVSSKDLEEI